MDEKQDIKHTGNLVDFLVEFKQIIFTCFVAVCVLYLFWRCQVTEQIDNVGNSAAAMTYVCYTKRRLY